MRLHEIKVDGEEPFAFVMLLSLLKSGKRPALVYERDDGTRTRMGTIVHAERGESAAFGTPEYYIDFETNVVQHHVFGADRLHRSTIKEVKIGKFGEPELSLVMPVSTSTRDLSESTDDPLFFTLVNQLLAKGEKVYFVTARKAKMGEDLDEVEVVNFKMSTSREYAELKLNDLTDQGGAGVWWESLSVQDMDNRWSITKRDGKFYIHRSFVTL